MCAQTFNSREKSPALHHLENVKYSRICRVVHNGHVSLEHLAQLGARREGHQLGRANSVDVHKRLRGERGLGVVQGIFHIIASPDLNLARPAKENCVSTASNVYFSSRVLK